MQTGAVIVAAGMSSRMGAFKPMLQLGSISIAQRIVTTFHQAGVEKIVVVTGYNALRLERHLAKLGPVFLRNERYAETEMFDSALIGLNYLRDKVERIFFTPVDIPLFTARTLNLLMESTAPVVCPVCDGQRGHPLLLDAALVERLAADGGDGGLQGALRRCGAEMTLVEVEDEGILHDADTPADYEALLRRHNTHLIRPEVQVALAREVPFFDEKTAMLLSLVEETRSVRTACARMQISYSTGWNRIRLLESQLPFPLLERSQGGAGGGESRLTEEGQRFLARYAAFAAGVREQARALFADCFGDLE